MKTILFVGNYPNNIEPTKNCFFQTLIYSIANNGYNCIVVSPVSVTHYGKKIQSIPQMTKENTPEGKTITVIYPRFITFSSKNIGGIKTGRLSEKNYQRTVLKTIKRYKLSFDYAYGHFFLVGGLAAVRAGRKYGKPSFVAFGEDSFDECISIPYGELTEKDLEGVSGIIAVSTNNKRILQEKPLFNNIPILVAPNGADKTVFAKREKTECRRILNVPQDKFIVGFVGSFDDRKGGQRLYDAVQNLKDVYVAFAGKGKDYSGDKVVFCKPLKRDLIPVFLHALDVFCLPTLSEGCSNALVEALASGLPIISSDLPFNDDILDDSNSIRVDPKDVNKIQAAIETLYNDQAMIQRLSRGAFSRARKLTIEERAVTIIAFIEKTVIGK